MMLSNVLARGSADFAYQDRKIRDQRHLGKQLFRLVDARGNGQAGALGNVFDFRALREDDGLSEAHHPDRDSGSFTGSGPAQVYAAINRHPGDREVPFGEVTESEETRPPR